MSNAAIKVRAGEVLNGQKMSLLMKMWSGIETEIAGRLRGTGKERAAVIAIKSAHTVIFAGMGSCVLNILYSGLTNRVSRVTKLSLAVVVLESLIFFGNGQRCPLTNVAEDLGSENGTVGDIFLPDWFAHRIPVISTTMVVIGLAAMGVHRVAGARRGEQKA